MKRFIRMAGPHAKLYRDDRTGIAWVADGSTGLGYSAHPNIDRTGSVTGMKKLGYWGKNDRTVRSNGFIYNISRLAVDPSVPYEKLAAQECRCSACRERVV